jgi:hypothetical protein
MSVGSLFKTRTSVDEPFDGSLMQAQSLQNTTTVSDFITVQSLTNFAAMTGAISAAWNALERLSSFFSTVATPYAFAAAFVLVSLGISTDGMKTGNNWDWGRIAAAVFIAVINGLILASAVIGASTIA